MTKITVTTMSTAIKIRLCWSMVQSGSTIAAPIAIKNKARKNPESEVNIPRTSPFMGNAESAKPARKAPTKKGSSSSQAMPENANNIASAPSIISSSSSLSDRVTQGTNQRCAAIASIPSALASPRLSSTFQPPSGDLLSATSRRMMSTSWMSRTAQYQSTVGFKQLSTLL